MNPVRGIVNSLVVDSPLPLNLTYLWGFGSILGLALVIQILTGVFLAMMLWSVGVFIFSTTMGLEFSLNEYELDTCNLLGILLIGRVKERGKLVYDIYRNSWLGEAIKDPEGDLMPKSIGRYTDTKIFKYSFGVICVLSLISRWVFKLSKVTGLSLYSEVLAIGCTISIMLFYIIVLMKALGVMYTFGNRIVSGYYMTGGGGMGGGKRGRRGIMTGAARAAIQAGRAVAGTVITTGALIQGANEIGEAMNRGKIGTEAAKKVAKAVGVYKEDTPKVPKPNLPKGSTDGRGG